MSAYELCSNYIIPVSSTINFMGKSEYFNLPLLANLLSETALSLQFKIYKTQVKNEKSYLI